MNEEARARVDEINKRLEEVMRPYIGKFNVTQEVLDKMFEEIKKVEDEFINDPQTFTIDDISGYTLDRITNDSRIQDCVNCVIHFRPPDWINVKFECTESGCKVID